jgi:hypothetical protein
MRLRAEIKEFAMSRNGSGVYSLPAGSTAVDDTIIDPVVFNTLISDLELDANTARPIVAGGTGATTAAAARTNLGATTIGAQLFTSADASFARGFLGATVAGSAMFIAADVAAQRTLLGFAQTTGTPRRLLFPGNMMLQGGTGTTSAGGSLALTFPFAFSATPSFVMTPIAGGGGVFMTFSVIGSSGTTCLSWVSNAGAAASITFHWLAFGEA